MAYRDEKRAFAELVKALEHLDLEVRTGKYGAGARLYRDGALIGGAFIAVNEGAEYEWWKGAENKHPITDPEGAAEAILRYLKAQDTAGTPGHPEP